ncbi:MAG: hypothetical protein K0S61_242 [Anaerocolumna sp.]|jgi:DegV family protein with EDD domain|nr:hypothetical protein [Anaerocolumna sp.]
MIKIVADSTCDLSPELLEQYSIDLIPLCVVMGEKTYLDGVNISPNEIYQWSIKENTTPKTAAPGIEKVIETLKPYVEQDYDIIFFGISEEMSSTCDTVRLSLQYLNTNKIHIINSKNLSTGIGLQVLKAATMVAAGNDAKAIVNYIESIMCSKVRASFIVDTLTFLHMGGRCSSVAALIGNALALKPMIKVNNGKMGVGKKYRGNNKKVLLHYLSDLKPELLKANRERVFITHSGCEDEVIDTLYKELQLINIFKEIHITRAGSVISSHCGPKTLGILYVEE